MNEHRNQTVFHLIDSEIMLRDHLEQMIVDAGYSVRCFDFAEQYLQFLQSSSFDKPVAVLSNVRLAAMSGCDLVLEIRKMQPWLKIALIFGSFDNEHCHVVDRQLCYTLEQPFQPQKLMALLASLVACEHAHDSGDKGEYFQSCEFGIDHNCPYYYRRQLKGDPTQCE